MPCGSSSNAEKMSNSNRNDNQYGNRKSNDPSNGDIHMLLISGKKHIK